MQIGERRWLRRTERQTSILPRSFEQRTQDGNQRKSKTSHRSWYPTATHG
jgi:hypothetical protein